MPRVGVSRLLVLPGRALVAEQEVPFVVCQTQQLHWAVIHP